MLIIVEAIAVWLGIVLVTMLIVGYLARRWGRDPFGWLLLSAAMGPIVIAGLIGTRQSDVERSRSSRAAGSASPHARKRALLACDGAPAGVEAARHLIATADPGTEAVLLTVLPGEALPSGSNALRADHQAGADAAVRNVESALRDAGITTRSVVAFGVPGEQIVEHADREQADVVIVGRRGAGLTRALLGSTSEYVVRHLRRPVVVVE